MTPELRSIVDRVVAQFSDPFAFLRELVQNSIDAGSGQVEFEMDYVQGCSVLTCCDTGEGMDEHLIETRLTRVFASSKQGDLTKIGQFGIGFLSVFALEPRDVVIDTGRNGRSWRVHFHSDRTFTTAPLSHPVEGTQIRWVKPQPQIAHARMQADFKATLQKWCPFVPARLSFNGQLIHHDFAFADPLAVLFREPGTEIALRPCHPEPGWTSYYQHGLTLAERQEPLVAGVQIRINSRFLEHTMTRDRLQQDRGFEKAVELVHRALRELLLPHLLAEVRRDFTAPDTLRLTPLVPWLRPEHCRLPLWPFWIDGAASIEQLQQQPEWLALEAGDPLAVGLEALGVRGLQQTDSGEELAAALGVRLRSARTVYADPPLLVAEGSEAIWLRRLAWILKVDDCVLADFRGQTAQVQSQAYLTTNDRQPPYRCDDDDGSRWLIHRYHPLLGPVFDLDPCWGPAPLCALLSGCFPIGYGEDFELLDYAMRDCPY